ncbi:MAG: hypothetical protein A2499_10170 [Stygiobacter sp. RIFOXYC12_FULL_38_8]|nr:MAG: hypothetical protein A2X62_12500 [Stygiobacter sp. GWC2_38_9]OGU81195.1 MAG: hypothetical protein A2279_05210 [Stygiobacter sp. RIFOXYA12_FULL_38_9]OGV06361.1 MAG: hypothetical protein A2299_12930 [Stygiobacter sp. RIFOXYB2_FULL_37_11]OGV11100.1 MAG: hypothetical protein A2237_04510 [Stygiobacter sp. RIFOXYA2_FULL_38_8]OGV16094.1 MAG: hypothetical protein A2440_03855 [Stygiobacter sp. RIFOXYC2_FULL_38_25]OGV28467.1 MAG: hypothetical protein A2499_10170 [Stygiobacter sp. RIFOXYC12_FULL_
MFWIIGGEYIFKGLDRAVNNSITNEISAQLDHAEWLGFTFYDIIMPLFMYLVGVSMVYSFRKRLSVDPSKANLWKHILIRIFWLWVLGMMLQGKLLTYDINEIKLYSNTLQAIAAGYIISALFILNLSIIKQIIATVGLMLVYWAVMVFAPIPGLGSGHFAPEVNFALYIDKLLLGKFQDGTTYTWIVSSLNFGATTMLGVFTGYLLQSDNKPLTKLYYLIIAGVALVVSGQVWGLVLPSIKHIWTSSFVLFSGGVCVLLLAFFYLLIDVLNFKKWSLFFIIIGSNAIAAYVSASLFNFTLVSVIFVGGLEKYVGAWYWFILATSGVAVLFLILRYMYKNKIFVKI